jgi:hypothetical protein
MRIAFFALVFANLCYFAWARWDDVPERPPVNPAIEALPRLRLAEEVPLSQRMSTPKVRIACLSVGPFGDVDNSAHAAAILKGKGFDPKQRAEEGQAQDGFWVYVAGITSQEETDKALVSLEHAGIKDAIVLPEASESGKQLRLSLGLYTDRAHAERRAQAVRETGLKAQVGERKIPATVYWVDLAPLPGMNTVPLDGLFAEGVGSRIVVQPCPPPASVTPASGPAAQAPATGTATTHPAPPAQVPPAVSNPPVHTVASAPPGQPPAAPKPL